MEILFLIPCFLFPYVLLFNIICIFTGFLMEEVFQNFILVMLLYLLIYVVFVLFCNIAYVAYCRIKKVDPKKMAKANMLLKLVQMPGYIAIFVMGVIFVLTIFTIGFSFFFVLYDCISIGLTGMIGLFAILQNKKAGEKLSPFYILVGISQFIFCIDVVGAILLYIQIGEVKNEEKKAPLPEIPMRNVSKTGVITFLGALAFGTVMALSEYFFPDVALFLGHNPVYDVFFYLSIALCLFGFIFASIKKNKSNTSSKEYIVFGLLTLFSFILLVSGIVFSSNLLGNMVFSFGSGALIVSFLGLIQTMIGRHKKAVQ